MSSFPAQAARVRDPQLPLRRRLLALRECVLHFAPYGFRATWHHLVVSAGLPVRLEADPGSLPRAVDELAEARELWLAEIRDFTTRRRREKHAGLRRPARDEGWLGRPDRLAFCPDPEVHPRERLAIVVGRLTAAYRSRVYSAARCPACGLPAPSRPCPSCGAWTWDPGDTAATPRDTGGGRPWPLIWHRVVARESTVGGGDIAQFRAEFTPGDPDPRFGVFQLYVRGVALGDGTATALVPHLGNLSSLAEAARRPGRREPEPLLLGDPFDHLAATLEATEHDLIFAFTARTRRMRLMVGRSEVVRAVREAEPRFRLI